MISVILLMAGRGTRMGIDKNKILLEVNNKPIFKYSLDLFMLYDFEIICVINELDKDIILPYLNSNKIKYVFGGKTRTESVYNGLNAASGDYVLIHDAARPLLNKSVVDEIINKKNDNDFILTYLPVKNTIKEYDGKLKTLDRTKLISAVTPQCGNLKLFKEAYEKAINSNLEFTDDISIIEHFYKDSKIELVLANEEVFKITTQLDLKLLKAILE